MVSCCIFPPFRTNPPPRAQAEARLRNASSDHGSRHRRACKLRWMLDVLAMGFLPPLRAGPGLAWLRKQARWRRCNAARLLNIGGATPRRRKIPVLEHESICQNPKWGLREGLLTARPGSPCDLEGANIYSFPPRPLLPSCPLEASIPLPTPRIHAFSGLVIAHKTFEVLLAHLEAIHMGLPWFQHFPVLHLLTGGGPNLLQKLLRS